MPRGKKNIETEKKRKAPKSKKQQEFSKGIHIAQYFRMTDKGNCVAAARGYMIKVDSSIMTGSPIIEVYHTIGTCTAKDGDGTPTIDLRVNRTTIDVKKSGSEDGLEIMRKIPHNGMTIKPIEGLFSEYENLYYSFPDDQEIATNIIESAFQDLIQKDKKDEDDETTQTEKIISKLIFHLGWLVNGDEEGETKKENREKKVKKYFDRLLEKDYEIHGPQAKEDEELSEEQKKEAQKDQEDRTINRATSLFVALSQLAYDSHPKSDLFVVPKEEIDLGYFGLKTAIMRILFYHN